MRPFVLGLLNVARVIAYSFAALGCLWAVRAIVRGLTTSDPFSLLGFVFGAVVAVGVWLLLGWGLSELQDRLRGRWEIAARSRGPGTP